MEFDLQREVDYYCSLFPTLVNKRLKIKISLKTKKKIKTKKVLKLIKNLKN